MLRQRRASRVRTVRDLMVTAVEQHLGYLTGCLRPSNGSRTMARATQHPTHVGLHATSAFFLYTPIESPQSNGMAEAFVRTFKRDYVAFKPKPDAATVIRSLPAWHEHYNALHPHRALGYRSPRKFIALKATSTGESYSPKIRGQQQNTRCDRHQYTDYETVGDSSATLRQGFCDRAGRSIRNHDSSAAQ